MADLMWLIVALLPWVIFVIKFRNVFNFLLVIENTMASMDNILKESGKVVSEKSAPVESKRQRIRNIVAAGQSKLFFGKEYTLVSIDKASEKQINELFEVYESKYSTLVSDSLLEKFLDLTGKGISYVAPIDDSQELSNDYKTDFVLTNELKKVTGQLAYTFGPALALMSVGLITAKHIKWDDLREKINFLDNNYIKENNGISSESGDSVATEAVQRD